MQKHSHIKALFFLGIFSLLLLHQVVPHWHHQHESKDSHNAVAHSDNHSHQQDVPEKDYPKKGLLDLFFDIHIHSVVANEILVTQESGVKQLNAQKDVKTADLLHRYSISVNYGDEADQVVVYHPPNTYFNPYLSSPDSRGPPSLG